MTNRRKRHTPEQIVARLKEADQRRVFCASVAQPVEQRILNPKVGGSRPSGGTIHNHLPGIASHRCRRNLGKTVPVLGRRALDEVADTTDDRAIQIADSFTLLNALFGTTPSQPCFHPA